MINTKFTRSKKWDRQLKILRKLSPQPVMSILDVGCRTGDFLMHIEPGIIKIVGIEPSDTADIARKRGLTIIKSKAEDVETMKYDIICAYAVIEHMENPFIFLDKIDTRLFATLIPTYESLKSRLMGPRWKMYQPGHLNFLSRKQLDSYMKGRGYKLAKRFYTSGGMCHKSLIIRKIIDMFDKSIFCRIPIFDYMYSYYVKKRNKQCPEHNV